jgi:hypothetical protein
LVVHAAIGGRVLKCEAEISIGRVERARIADHQFDADGRATGAQHIDVLREEPLVGEEPVRIGQFLRPCRVKHVHGLGDGGGLVKQ